MTKQEKSARALIMAWLKENGIKPTGPLRHVHSRAYVIGYAAAQCLVVARPWMDSEKHMQDGDKNGPLDTIHKFDKTLKAGDWCATAYVMTGGWGQTVAVAWKDVK